MTQQFAAPFDGILDGIESWSDFDKLKPKEHIKLAIALLNALDNQGSIHDRVDWILNPKNPKTSSFLTEGQTEAGVFAQDAFRSFPVMSPTKEDFDERLLINISLKGRGIDKALAAISLEDALKKLGLTGRIGQDQDTRGFVGKHFTQRGQSPAEVEQKQAKETEA